MGYTTTVMILNDNFHQIEKHPDRFVLSIVDSVRSGNDHAFGQTSVMPTDHNSVFHCYSTEGNLMIDLSPYAMDTVERIHDGDPVQRRILWDRIEKARDYLNKLEAMMIEVEP